MKHIFGNKSKKTSGKRLASRLFSAAALVLIAALSLGSCISAPTSAEAAYTISRASDNEIRMWIYPVGDFINPDKVSGFIASFNENYPDIKVNVEFLDYATGDDRVAAAISNGTAPDIVMEGPERIVANWGAKGYMADLSDMWTDKVKKDISKNDDMVEKACRGADGAFYEYPLCETAHCMAINYDVFEKADALKFIDLENRTWTADGFRKACRAVADSGLVETPGVIYCGGQGGDQGTRALVTNLFGAEFTDEKNTRYTVNSPEGVSAFKFLVEMTKEGSLSYDTTIQAANELSLFASGKTAMSFAWNASNEKHYAFNSNFRIFPVAFPTDMPQPELCSGIWGFGVFDNGNAAKIENSKKLIKFLCDDDTQAPKSVKATGFFPVRSSLSGVYDGTPQETLMAPFDELRRFATDYYSTTPAWSAQRTFWWLTLQKIFSGTRIETALNEYSSLANSAAEGDGSERKNKLIKGSASRVLFISSFTLGYPGVNALIDGINDGLAQDAYLHCEFMDSTSISGDEYVETFYQYICEKYGNIKGIGAVIVGGDAALNMVIRYQNGFFSDIPVIYNGIHSSSLAELADSLGMSGFSLVNTIVENMDLACRLKPETKKLYVISDNSMAGRALSAFVMGIRSRYSPRDVIIIDTSKHTNSEIKNTLASIDEDSFVIYMLFTKDSSGNSYRYDHAVQLVTKHSKAPVLSLLWMNNGTLGSISIDNTELGTQVAYLTNRALGIGDSDAKIDMNAKHLTHASFNVPVMKKFEVSRWSLPRGSTYYNGISTVELMSYIAAGLAVVVSLFAFLVLFYKAENKRRKENESLLMEQNRQITEEAEVDSLTGLGNRRLFDKDIRKSISSGRSFSLFLIDLDRFKNINDTYGHLTGDAVLRETGNRLLRLKVRAFVPYRYGGDEFAVLYFHSEDEDVGIKANEVLTLFDTAIATDSGDISLEISLGAADFPNDAATAEVLIECADKALYYVKGNGRNAFKKYSEVAFHFEE